MVLPCIFNLLLLKPIVLLPMVFRKQLVYTAASFWTQWLLTKLVPHIPDREANQPSHVPVPRRSKNVGFKPHCKAPHETPPF
jgi:hypothetical protein